MVAAVGFSVSAIVVVVVDGLLLGVDLKDDIGSLVRGERL